MILVTLWPVFEAYSLVLKVRMLVSGPFYTILCCPEPGSQPCDGVSIVSCAFGQGMNFITLEVYIPDLFSVIAMYMHLGGTTCSSTALSPPTLSSLPPYEMQSPHPFSPLVCSSLLLQKWLQNHCHGNSCHLFPWQHCSCGPCPLAGHSAARRKMLQKKRQLFSATELCSSPPSLVAASKVQLCSHRSLLSRNYPVCTSTLSQSIAQPSCTDGKGPKRQFSHWTGYDEIMLRPDVKQQSD